ncbi:hypothetical protein E2C01_099058 [Portunus trituberculatus]|uniref:Uncharacterized protein n=1 Tax=Portunus trituberculatus TaxID=210409 RepID=A0A5B7K8K6_PORTR|nr:hypothetical protein [Portunus trituberculatus]
MGLRTIYTKAAPTHALLIFSLNAGTNTNTATTVSVITVRHATMAYARHATPPHARFPQVAGCTHEAGRGRGRGEGDAGCSHTHTPYRTKRWSHTEQ